MTPEQRAELRRLYSEARSPELAARERHIALHNLADTLVWTGMADQMRGDLPVLLDALEAAERDRDAARRWRDDVIEINRRDLRLLAAAGIKESCSGDAISRLVADRDALLRVAKSALACVEWDAGVWGDPLKPCVRLSRERFDAIRAEVERQEGK